MAPANTPIGLTLNSPLSSKNNVTGDKFSMTVAQDLMIDERFAVPKGTPAVGLITYTKGNGSFGSPARWKSPSSISNSAASRSRWTASIFTRVEGNTAGTVGAVLAAGVTGGLVVKGESADIVGGKAPI